MPLPRLFSRLSPSRRPVRSRLAVEELEKRLTPTILFNPQYGAETASGGTASGSVLSSPAIHLIFWGSYWQGNPTNPSIGDIQQDLQRILSASYLSGLTEYGSDGHATYDSSKDQIDPNDPPQNFADADIHAAVDSVIASLANLGVPTPNHSTVPPIYVVVTPPGINSIYGYPATASYNGWYYWGASQTPTSFVWLGTTAVPGMTTADLDAGYLSHEIAERISAGNGNNGVTVTPGASWTSGGGGQISDAEAVDFHYRLNDGALVQPYWSQHSGAYVVPTGQLQNFVVTNNALTINGDQLGANYADQVSVNVAANGTLQVTLNGETAQFNGPDYYSESRILSIHVKTGGGSDTVSVAASVNLPITVDNSANNLQSAVQQDGSTLYTTPTPLPDIAPYTPSGWSGPLVIATQTGSITDAASITAADTVSVDWAVTNLGPAAVASAFQTQLLLDGNVVHAWTTSPPLNPSTYTYIQGYSLGQLTAGSHTLTVQFDALNQVMESNESNNTVTRTFTVLPAFSWRAVSETVGNDGNTRLLWTSTSGTAIVWTVSASTGQVSAGPTYGPYAGWTATRIAAGADGDTRLLWQHTSGQVSLWVLDAAGNFLNAVGYGPYSGWTAGDIGVGPDDSTRLLWTNSNGTAVVWSINTSTGQVAAGPGFGPYSGWTATHLATDANRNSHLVWQNANGQTALWLLDAGGNFVSALSYGANAGWSVSDVSVGSDGNTRLLWTNTNGTAVIWSVDTATGQVTAGPGYGPYAGWTVTHLAIGTDGALHLLWAAASGAESLWALDTAGNFQSAQAFGPY